ncbi:unnamed protein product [Zymoseptoria tritici ST99CH_1E4]|nr:unnamed protein product [Zymoseptoria tritici ST99CH_1E4]
MVRRQAGQQIAAITAVLFDGATVDLFFHRYSIAETEAVYRSLDHSGSTVIVRHAVLRPCERSINVGVRVRRVELGRSSACLLLLTSEHRIFDMGPYLPEHMRARHDFYSLLNQSGPVEAVHINRRLDYSTTATIAVQSDRVQVYEQTLSAGDWLSDYRSSEEEPACRLRHHYISVFKDALVLEGLVDCADVPANGSTHLA